MNALVAIDAQLMVGTATGIGEYLQGLLPAFGQTGLRIEALREPRLDPWRFDRRIIWDQLLLPYRARNANLLHCAAGTIPFGRRAPVIVTVHDVAWFRTQHHTRAYARTYFGPMMLNRYRQAARIMVDSIFSRDELLSLGGFEPSRVDVVYPGVAADFMNLARVPLAARSGPPMILAVGTVERRKNLEVVIRALAAMKRRDVALVAIGPPTPYLDECKNLAKTLHVADRFTARGYVSRAELLDAYAQASIAVVPSHYEGFGYAAAQALVAGVPVLAAKASSLPEIVADDAALLNPDDSLAWAEHLNDAFLHLAEWDAHAQRVRERARERFDWPRAAAQTLAAYRMALAC